LGRREKKKRDTEGEDCYEKTTDGQFRDKRKKNHIPIKGPEVLWWDKKQGKYNEKRLTRKKSPLLQ